MRCHACAQSVDYARYRQCLRDGQIYCGAECLAAHTRLRHPWAAPKREPSKASTVAAFVFIGALIIMAGALALWPMDWGIR